MRRRLPKPERALAALIALVLLTGASAVHATLSGQCCACVPDPKAMSSGAGPRLTPAFFCAEAETGAIMDLQQQCEAEAGALFCAANIPGPSCAAQLAEEGYLCPSAGVPAAGELTLIGLAAALTLLGAVEVGRRAGQRIEVRA